MNPVFRTWIVLGVLVCAMPTSRAAAADHGDTPFLIESGRHDARITDLYAFLRNDRLVLVVCLDPTIPEDVTEYTFASDLEVTLEMDNDSQVTFDNADDMETFGGTIVDPGAIGPDVVFTFRFDANGALNVASSGLTPEADQDVTAFSGLRDDPFIRGPRQRRNVAAIVLEIDMDHVKKDQNTLLIWATSKVDEFGGPFQDMAGMALRSQFVENDSLNSIAPQDHQTILGVTPDVIILDTSRPTVFPNGRELADDVVDLVGDTRVLDNDDPFPAVNDRPFLNEFPYLAEPHGMVSTTPPPPTGCGSFSLTGALLLMAAVGMLVQFARRASHK